MPNMAGLQLGDSGGWNETLEEEKEENMWKTEEVIDIIPIDSKPKK